jgi:hypothetical protein
MEDDGTDSSQEKLSLIPRKNRNRIRRSERVDWRVEQGDWDATNDVGLPAGRSRLCSMWWTCVRLMAWLWRFEADGGG